jgi:hypothetical protein
MCVISNNKNKKQKNTKQTNKQKLSKRMLQGSSTRRTPSVLVEVRKRSEDGGPFLEEGEAILRTTPNVSFLQQNNNNNNNNNNQLGTLYITTR